MQWVVCPRLRNPLSTKTSAPHPALHSITLTYSIFIFKRCMKSRNIGFRYGFYADMRVFRLDSMYYFIYSFIQIMVGINTIPCILLHFVNQLRIFSQKMHLKSQIIYIYNFLWKRDAIFPSDPFSDFDQQAIMLILYKFIHWRCVSGNGWKPTCHSFQQGQSQPFQFGRKNKDTTFMIKAWRWNSFNMIGYARIIIHDIHHFGRKFFQFGLRMDKEGSLRQMTGYCFKCKDDSGRHFAVIYTQPSGIMKKCVFPISTVSWFKEVGVNSPAYIMGVTNTINQIKCSFC